MPASLGHLTDADKALYGGRDLFEVVKCDLGHGHREAYVRRRTVLSDLPAWWGRPRNERWDREAAAYVVDDVVRGEGNHHEARVASARRARRVMRQRVKSLGLDSMGTLTYRDNVTDRALVLSHWKEFVRRVRRLLPEFAYVAVLEEQKRGALHVHVAYHRLPKLLPHAGGAMVKSYSVLIAMWRAVIGGNGGAFHDSARKGRGSPLRIARYISKYVGKSFEQSATFNKRQYFAGGEWSAPTRLTGLHAEQLGALAEAFSFIAGYEDCELMQIERYGLVWMASYSGPVPVP